MEAMTESMVEAGFTVTGTQVDKKWKSFLKDFRSLKDENAQSGAARIDPPGGAFGTEVNDLMDQIMGEQASTRAKALVGKYLCLLPPITAGNRPPGEKEASNLTVSEVRQPTFQL